MTFTLKKGVELPEKDIEKYIISQFTERPALCVKEAHIVKEYTKANVPHWHIAVKTTKFLAKNRFNYYEKKFGMIDISKSTNKSLQESINYINKDILSTKIV